MFFVVVDLNELFYEEKNQHVSSSKCVFEKFIKCGEQTAATLSL